MKKSIAACAVAAAAMLAACGGGGGTTPVPTTGPTVAPAANAVVAFSIIVPQAPQNTVLGGKHSNFTTAPGAQSVSIALQTLNGSQLPSSTPLAPTVANLSSSTPGCTTANNQLTCIINANVFPGSDVFVVSTFSQPNAQGTNLGSGTVTVQSTAGQTTSAPATLSGTVASITITPGVALVGSPATVPVAIVAKDASGNAIIGSYNAPITLADTDASNQTSLSTTTVSDSTSAAAITLAYKGGAMPNPATISASMTGLASSAITNGTFSPNTNVPLTNGSVFKRQFTSFGVITYFDGQTPRPIPTITPVDTMVVSNGATFGGQSGLLDLNYTSTGYPDVLDDFYLPVAGQTVAADAYIGYTDNDLAQGYSGKSICSAPYSVYTVQPFTSYDALTGTGSCAYEADNSGSAYPSGTWTDVLKGVSNADGSYTSTETYTDPTPDYDSTFNYVVNSDATTMLSYNSGFGSYIITLATPAPSASTIPATVQTFTGALPSPGATGTPAPVATSVPNMYAALGDTAAPNPLNTDVFTNKGIVTALPAACLISGNVLGTSPVITEVDEASSYTDPTIIAYVHSIQHYYLAGIGEICYTATLKKAVFPLATIQSTYHPALTLSTYTETDYITLASVVAAARTQGTSAALPAAAAALSLSSRQHLHALQHQAMRERMTAQHSMIHRH